MDKEPLPAPTDAEMLEMTLLDNEIQNAEYDLGWLIEIDNDKIEGTYLFLYDQSPRSFGFVAPLYGFTTDHEKALRFARKVDAYAFMTFIDYIEPKAELMKYAIACEHMWDATNSTKEFPCQSV